MIGWFVVSSSERQVRPGLVIESRGHTHVPTALKYQHPELVLEIVREVINSRQTPRHTRQTAN